MDIKFSEALKTYYQLVNDACDELVKYIEDTEQIKIADKKDLYKYFSESSKYEFIIGDRHFLRHGVGMRVVQNKKIVIDWDFGGGEGQWCVIDPFFMAKTLQSAGYEEKDCCDAAWIKQKCELYAEKGLMQGDGWQYYTDFYKKE